MILVTSQAEGWTMAWNLRRWSPSLIVTNFPLLTCSGAAREIFKTYPLLQQRSNKTINCRLVNFVQTSGCA